MTDEEIQMIPISEIRILNPRHRDRRKFEQIVQSIQNLGLKKPIQVSRRSAAEGGGLTYDLVCGQGRIEAFKALGHKEIPAVIVDVAPEDRLLRSLVENIARRLPSRLALMNEIDRLKSEGYSNVQIGKKLDISDVLVGGYIQLQNAGEERLLEAAISGKIPLGVAIDIAKTEGIEMQRELLKAYENKQLNQFSIRSLRRIVEQRRFLGKSRTRGHKSKQLTSAESLVNAYKKETQRQKVLVRKARFCEVKLLFIVQAFQKLAAEHGFIELLKSESLFTLPKYLMDKLALGKQSQSAGTKAENLRGPTWKMQERAENRTNI